MSTILKALRRLEREKSERPDRPLREAVTRAVPPPRRRRGRWIAAVGVLAGALAVAALVFPMLSSREEAEPEGPVEIAAAPQKPTARPASKRRRSSARKPPVPARQRERPARAANGGTRIVPPREPAAPPGLSPEALASEVEVVERLRPAKPTVQSPSPESARQEAPLPGPETGLPADRAAAERVQVAAAAPAAKPPATRRAEPAPKSAAGAAAPAPIRRSPVPNVYVERTIWHPLAERRVAVVELEGIEGPLELHEGDVVGPLVVGKIEPSDVLFIHDGVEMKRRVGVR
jgi:hypothetical protein